MYFLGVICLLLLFVISSDHPFLNLQHYREPPFNNFLVVFSFFEKLSIVDKRDVCPYVRLSSVETISFRGNLISNRPIVLKFDLNVWGSACIVLYCIVLYCIVLYCIVLYCIMRPYTDGPIGPLSYRHSSGVVRNPHSALTE